MNSNQYREARKLRGSQARVAALLSVRPATISARETGASRITREAEMALLALPEAKL